MAFCAWLVILMLARGCRCSFPCQGPAQRPKDAACESQSCFTSEDPAGRGLAEASCWSGNGTEVLFLPGAGVEHLHLKMEMRKEECASEVRFVRYNVSLARLERGAWHQFVLDFVEVYQHHLFLFFRVALDGRVVALVNSGYYKHHWRYIGYSVWVNGSLEYGPGCVQEKPKENHAPSRSHAHETTPAPIRRPTTRKTEDSTATQLTPAQPNPTAHSTADGDATQTSPATSPETWQPAWYLLFLFITAVLAFPFVCARLTAFLLAKRQHRTVTLGSRGVTMGVSSLFQRRDPNDPYPVMLAREWGEGREE